MNLTVEGLKKLISEDARKSDRLQLPIKISYLINPQGEWSKAYPVEDIGGNGLKFCSTVPLTAHTAIKVKLFFPEPHLEPIVVKAEVAWSKHGGKCHHVGVQFKKMQYEERKKFVSYICERIILKEIA